MLSCIKYKKLWKQKGGTLLVLITVTPSYHCPGASSCLSLHVIPVKEWQPVHHLSPPFTQCQLGRLQLQYDPDKWSTQWMMDGCKADYHVEVLIYMCTTQHKIYGYISLYICFIKNIMCIIHLSHCVKVYILSGELPAVQCVVNNVVGAQNNSAATCLFSCSSTSHPLVGKGKDKC